MMYTGQPRCDLDNVLQHFVMQQIKYFVLNFEVAMYDARTCFLLELFYNRHMLHG